MSKSTTQTQAILNTARGISMPTWAPWLAVFVGDPLAGGAEVIGGSYARRFVTFGPPTGNVASNSIAILFPTPTALWGVCTHFALMDAETGGAVRYTYRMGGTDAERTVDASSQPISLSPGTITLWET